MLCGPKWCRERRAVNNRKSSETELLCMLFICHSTYILCTLFSSPVHLLHFLHCGCWTSKWIEKCRNRRFELEFVPCRSKSQCYQVQLITETELTELQGVFCLSFSIALGKIPQEKTKNSLHTTTLSSTFIHPQKAYSLCHCALIINLLEISKQVGKHSTSNRKFIPSRVHRQTMSYYLRSLQEI